jgi:hypothetical protein
MHTKDVTQFSFDRLKENLDAACIRTGMVIVTEIQPSASPSVDSLARSTKRLDRVRGSWMIKRTRPIADYFGPELV